MVSWHVGGGNLLQIPIRILEHFYRIVNEIPTILLIIIVVMTVVQPFSP